MKVLQSKSLSEIDELKSQNAQLKTLCQQFEGERLPLITQLEYADRTIRQLKKQQQQQQQSAVATSTTVQHPTPLQSIENSSTSSNNKSLSRLIRSPSLDMRVMRRTSELRTVLHFPFSGRLYSFQTKN